MDEYLDPAASSIKDDDVFHDNWQPVGRVVRKIARDLCIPPATAIALLEANRIRIEAAE